MPGLYLKCVTASSMKPCDERAREMTASISPIDHLCHDKTLIGDGHRAGERHDLETVAVADHALEHIDRFAEPPATERGLRHGSDEVIDGLRVRHVERPKRFEAVVMPRVSRAIEAHVSSSGCRLAGVYPIPQPETTLRGGRADRVLDAGEPAVTRTRSQAAGHLRRKQRSVVHERGVDLYGVAPAQIRSHASSAQLIPPAATSTTRSPTRRRRRSKTSSALPERWAREAARAAGFDFGGRAAKPVAIDRRVGSDDPVERKLERKVCNGVYVVVREVGCDLHQQRDAWRAGARGLNGAVRSDPHRSGRGAGDRSTAVRSRVCSAS